MKVCVFLCSDAIVITGLCYKNSIYRHLGRKIIKSCIKYPITSVSAGQKCVCLYIRYLLLCIGQIKCDIFKQTVFQI